MTHRTTKLANARATNSRSLLILKDVYRNKNEILFSIIAMLVHRILAGEGSISSIKHFLATVSKRDGVGPLEKINHSRPILVIMDRGVSAGL